MTDGIVIYGAGKRCQELLELISEDSIQIMAIIDADCNKIGTTIGKYTVQGKDSLHAYSDAYWCISVSDWRIYENIKKELITGYHMKEEKLISYDSFFIEELQKDDSIRKMLSKISHEANVHAALGDVYFDLLNGLGLGGIEERVKMLVMEMLKAGRDNVFIISNQYDYEYEEKEVLDAHVLKANVVEGDRRATIENLIKMLSERVPCTVVTNQPQDLMIAADIIKSVAPDAIRIISIVSGSHEILYDRYLKLPVRSDLYVGVSEDIARSFNARGARNVTSMKVPFPCDEIISREYSVDADEPIRIGYAGRLDGFQNSQKRMDLILQMLKLLNTQQINFRFEIAGEGPAEQEMRSFIASERIDEKVSFCGRLSKKEMMGFWKKQDIGVNLADYEGRSISIAEMMGGGAVPIVTDVSGVREDITDGINGYIIPVGDYKEAANKIVYLYLHRQLLLEMGQRAHEDIWPKSRMDEHLKFWNNLLEME